MKLNIAVVQFAIKSLDPKYNLEKMESFISEAKARGAQVVAFPEDVVTGSIEGLPQYSDTEGHYVRHFQSLAEKYSIDILPGSFIEVEDGKEYNVSYYIDSQGKILGRHKKKYLWKTEGEYYARGTGATIFDTSYGKVGILICWDMAFPDLWQEMLESEVQVIFCPSYWSYEDAGAGQEYNKDSEVAFVNSLISSRAFLNESVVVFINPGREVTPVSWSSIGRSQITAPFLGPIKRLDHNNEEMFIEEVDLDILKIAENIYKIRNENTINRD